MGSQAYSDRDFSGLFVVSDAGMAKAAGQMPYWSPATWASRKVIGDNMAGNVVGTGVDMASMFLPYVGTAATGYDTVRGFWNGTDDLIHGKFGRALGNYGSGLLNAGFLALDFLGGFGTVPVGSWIRGAGKAILGAKNLTRAANAANRARNVIKATGVGAAALRHPNIARGALNVGDMGVQIGVVGRADAKEEEAAQQREYQRQMDEYMRQQGLHDFANAGNMAYAGQNAGWYER